MNISDQIVQAKHFDKINKYSSHLIARGLNLALSIKTKNDSNYFESLLKEAIDWCESRDYQKSLNILNKILASAPQPNNVDLWKTKAKSLSKLNRYLEAINSFYKILEIDGNTDCLYALLLEEADELCYEDKHREALLFHETAVKVKPDDSWGYYSQGMTQFVLGLYEEAILSFNKSIAIEIDDSEVWKWLADALHQLERYEEELLAYEQLIQINPSESYLWIGKANSLYKLYRYTDALNAYEKAIGFGSKHVWVWLEKGEILDKLQRYEEANLSYHKASILDFIYTVNWLFNKAKELSDLNNFAKAARLFERVIEIQPEYFEAWYNKGYCLFNLQEYERAISAFDKAITIRSQSYQNQAWYLKGVASYNLQKYQDAIQCFQQAVKIEQNCFMAFYFCGAALIA